MYIRDMLSFDSQTANKMFGFETYREHIVCEANFAMYMLWGSFEEI